MKTILTIALALIIGSPNCWCCFGARASAGATAKTSCCAHARSTSGNCPMKQDGAHKPGSEKSCTCDSANATREVIASGFIVPDASAIFMIVPPQASVLDSISPAYTALDSVMSHGPPCHPRPIYELDCVLRL